MKKTLSLVLALALAVSMIASMALIVPSATTSTDPLLLTGVKVTDAAGYAAPYSAVDSAAAFVENMAAYVVVSFEVKSVDNDDYGLLTGTDAFKMSITSSTLDLSYANTTKKFYTVVNDVITNATALSASSVAAGEVKFDTTRTAMGFAQDADSSNKYYYTFIGVTKAATAGEVKASMTVSGTKFDTASPSTLKVYDATGLKYIVKKATIAGNEAFTVYTNTGISGAADKELFSYVNVASKFGYIANSKSIAADDSTKVDFFGKITYDNGTDTVDITDTVNAVNTYFGFSFTNTDYPVEAKHFEAKTVGNPVVVTDTYAYVTAAVTDGDGDVDIAPTGDFSANIVIVMAASAVLAAAALAFVAKKARD